MRYAQIRHTDISNGEGIGVSIFVQGCNFHCKGCFNKETWNFNGGKEYTSYVYKQLEECANKPYVKRLSILGGEPLDDRNVLDVYLLISKFKNKFPTKKIWLFSGYTWEEIMNQNDDVYTNVYRKYIIESVDVFIDGRYDETKRDFKLKFRGSSNQRIIDVQKTLIENKLILLYEEE